MAPRCPFAAGAVVVTVGGVVSGPVERENHVDPVVGRPERLVREPAAPAIAKDAVAAGRITQGVQRAVVDAVVNPLLVAA